MLAELVHFVSHMVMWVLHAGSVGSFPKALSAEEEHDCLVRMAKGDREARKMLIEHNLRLVAHITKKYYATAADSDDLISIGTIGLIKAVSTFDAGKGIRLATYASRCIENEILMYFRSAKKMAQDVSLSDPIDTDSQGNALSLVDVIADDYNMLDDMDLRLQSEKLGYYVNQCLDPRERTILALRYGLGCEPLAQREVAAKLGISRSYVSRIEKKALEKLRKAYESGKPIDKKGR